MKTGDIVLVPFPYSDLENVKVRPAVVVTITKDKYNDIVVCAISSVIPNQISDNEMTIKHNSLNKLRVDSILKVDRIVTLKQKDKIANLGKLSSAELKTFKTKFSSLVQ